MPGRRALPSPCRPLSVVIALVLLGACAGPAARPGAATAPTTSVSPTPTQAPTGTPGSAPTTTPARSAAATPRYPAYSATATGRQVAVFDRPGGAVTHRLSNPGLLGSPLTFLVVQDRRGWLQVRLPVKPNGATGWVQASSVRLAGLRFRLDLLRSAHELRLYDGGRLVTRYPVAVGTADTPTPGGTYYLDALVAVSPPTGAYGPWAFGLNAFPPGIEVFNGQQAVIGLHGTDRPELIGRDVSHGCIRMRDADITRLAGLLPLGTPVRILP